VLPSAGTLYLASDYTGSGNDIQWFVRNTGISEFYVRNDGTLAQNLLVDLNPYLDGFEHSAIVQQSDDGKELSIYIDGVLKDSDTTATAYPPSGATEMQIGAQSGVQRLEGYVCCVGIYDRELTSSEILGFCDNPPVTGSTFLPLENHLYDISGNENHATLGAGSEVYVNESDCFHWNIRKGYGLDGSGNTIPVDVNGDYVAAVDTEYPAGPWHNGADTSIAVGVVAGPGEWYEVNESPSLSVRRGHAMLSHDNKIWIIGGEGASGLLNDVWYSEDNGLTWTNATSSADFSARKFFSTAVFDGKMWVIGGDTASGLVNDVWYSTDGVTWTDAGASGHFTERRLHTSVFFDSKIWVIAGDTDSGYVNDVWYSADGVTWTDAGASGHFTARYAHSSTVFDSKMWVIAGNDDTSRLNDAWSSTDGVSWTEVTDDASFEARLSHCTVTADSRMWLIGGISASGYNNDVWFSEDGENWYQYQKGSSFDGIIQSGCCIDDGQIIISFGKTASAYEEGVHTLASDWIIDSRVQEADTEEHLHNAATGLVKSLEYSDLQSVWSGDYLFMDVTTEYRYKNLVLYKINKEPTWSKSVEINKFVGNTPISSDEGYLFDEDGHVLVE